MVLTPPFGLPAIKLLGLALLLQACAGQREGAPAGAGANAVDRRTLHERALVSMRAECVRPASPADRSEDAAARRNRLLRDLMLAIDMRHAEYELALMRARGPRGRRAQSELRIITGVAAAWSRADGAVRGDGSGPRTRAERERLRGGISVILWTQMRANRAAARAAIMGQFALPYESWSTCSAMLAAVAYEQAGTLDAAIDELRAATARAAEAAEAAEAARLDH